MRGGVRLGFMRVDYGLYIQVESRCSYGTIKVDRYRHDQTPLLSADSRLSYAEVATVAVPCPNLGRLFQKEDCPCAGRLGPSWKRFTLLKAMDRYHQPYLPLFRVLAAMHRDDVGIVTVLGLGRPMASHMLSSD